MTTATGIPGDSRTRQTYSPFGANVYRASYSTTAGPWRTTRNACDAILRGVANLAPPIHAPSLPAHRRIGGVAWAASAGGLNAFVPGAGISNRQELVSDDEHAALGIAGQSFFGDMHRLLRP